MKVLFGRRTMVLALALLLAAGGAASADDRQDADENDHDEARRAVEEGRIRSLAEILGELGGLLGGEIVGVDLERQGERYVYEFKVITPSGSLREVYVDAATAEIQRSGDE
jgi:uncharacterized membrane protein YkoI